MAKNSETILNNQHVEEIYLGVAFYKGASPLPLLEHVMSIELTHFKGLFPEHISELCASIVYEMVEDYLKAQR